MQYMRNIVPITLQYSSGSAEEPKYFGPHFLKQDNNNNNNVFGYDGSKSGMSVVMISQDIKSFND